MKKHICDGGDDYGRVDCLQCEKEMVANFNNQPIPLQPSKKEPESYKSRRQAWEEGPISLAKWDKEHKEPESKDCNCGIEYDENQEPFEVICEKHKEEYEARLRKEYEEPESNWKCGKCEQKTFRKGERIEEHSRHCPKRKIDKPESKEGRNAQTKPAWMDICPEPEPESKEGYIGECPIHKQDYRKCDECMPESKDWEKEFEKKFVQFENGFPVGGFELAPYLRIKDFIRYEKKKSWRLGWEDCLSKKYITTINVDEFLIQQALDKRNKEMRIFLDQMDKRISQRQMIDNILDFINK